MKIQLLTFPGCPNADAAREALRRTLIASGMSPRFEDVDVSASDTLSRLRAWGSPTILVGGRDVAGAAPTGPGCRLYDGTPEDLRGVPPDTLIREALNDARSRRPRSLAVLSALGLGFVATERVVAPLIGLFLALGLGTVAWSIRSHGRLGPLVITVVGSGAVVAGRLVWVVPVLLYGGVSLLVGASLWNLWLKRPRSEPLVQIRVGR